jgi:hypothetical protein
MARVTFTPALQRYIAPISHHLPPVYCVRFVKG